MMAVIGIKSTLKINLSTEQNLQHLKEAIINIR